MKSTAKRDWKKLFKVGRSWRTVYTGPRAKARTVATCAHHARRLHGAKVEIKLDGGTVSIRRAA